MFYKFNLNLMTALSITLAAVLIVGGSACAEDGLVSQMALTVRAKVKGSCAVSQTATDDIWFGQQNEISAPDEMNAGGVVVFTCSDGIPYSIKLGNGNNYENGRRMKHQSENKYIPYDLDVWPSSGMGKGASSEITGSLTGTLHKTAFKDMPMGYYNDAVLITVEAN